MINPTQLFRHSTLVVGIAAIALGGTLTGCSEEPPPPAVTKRPRKVEPPPPRITTIAELMARHGIDDRVVLRETSAPSSDEERVALLTFFNGFATAQPEQIRPFLGPLEQEELDKLVQWGDLDRLAGEIEEIEIFTGASSDGRPAVFAMYWLADRGEGQMWIVDRSAGAPRMEAAPAPPGISELLGEDPFADWFAVVEREKVVITEPDLGLRAAKAKHGESGEESDPFGPDSGGGGKPRGTPNPGV